MPTSRDDLSKKNREILKKHAAKSHSEMSGIEESNNAAEAMEQPIVGYRMIEKMGSGGMAAVFRAENIATGQQVALKLLFPGHDQDKNVLQQFINEGMLLLKLDHPNILKALDFGLSKGIYFLALEFIHGESLIPFIERGLKFTEEHAFKVILQICHALAYLEQRRVVHRDIKPANILLLADVAKLCDFALALDLSRVQKSDLDNEVTCGTVEYISPEQARGETQLDGRSDIYSLGITCIQMITGKLPFSGDSAYEIMRCQIYEPIDLESFGNFSFMARHVLSKMIAKDKNERYTASKLIKVLEKLYGDC